ncbi:dipeptidase [Fulvivirgaceae bacterium BMA10]|uniref:Dipeptidase n=1 Tax=Splendidivirga corallicola TaxID=3051826 RepID=A0ABT8KYT3_9BACT|nr:dipeptidase [Fulvivirgaceae bacterium BMA10]
MKYLLFFVFIFFVSSCSEKKSSETNKEEPMDLAEKAKQIAHNTIITDGHVDLPYRLQVKYFKPVKVLVDVSKRTEDGDFDYVRAKEGGLDAPFMSIYVPSRYQKTGGAKSFADSLISLVEDIVQTYPEQFALARSPEDVEKNFNEKKISLPLGMENGAPIEDDIANVKHFYDRGIRYITLTHATDNQICDSSYDDKHTWNGLSPFGREVVQEMNSVGIMVDISHVSDSAFYQVMELTKAPAIASHSSCRKFTPGFERNMSDDMIKRLGENGGVIQINFGSTFLDKTVSDANEENREKLGKLLEEKGLNFGDSLAKPIIEQFKKDNPTLFSDVKMVANHIDHVVELAGIDHVGLGSDYDGVGDSLPTGLKDVSMYPNLIHELLERGYSEEDIEKICYKNVFRVWKEVQKIAGQS